MKCITISAHSAVAPLCAQTAASGFQVGKMATSDQKYDHKVNTVDYNLANRGNKTLIHLRSIKALKKSRAPSGNRGLVIKMTEK